ncbi:VOC family protein [Roseibium sp.]|uniref:VOC family protein n=1 Tax=Roseibium sp. TaxID=1936156 RepID=UPI003A9723A8
MEQRITMTTLAVADLAETRRFFEEGLGGRPAVGGNEHVAFYQLPGAILGLYDRAHLEKDLGRSLPKETLGGMTLAWNGRSEADVDEVYEQAVKAGAGPLTRPEKVFWGGYSGYLEIPGGHLLEVAYNPFWTLKDDGTVELPS